MDKNAKALDMLIEESINDFQVFDSIRNNEPLAHEQAYAMYHVEVENDPRTWFVDA